MSGNNVVSPAFYGGRDEGLRDTQELERLFRAAYETRYMEPTYTSDDLTRVEIWEDATKLVKLFTRDLTYTGDNLTQTVTTDEQTGAVLTIDLGYTGDDLTSVAKAVT